MPKTKVNDIGLESYLNKIRKLDSRQRLLHWIRQREQVRVAKSQGKPKPWTEDPIIQQFRFCNVRRMDDRVSVWIHDNWYCPNFNHANMVIAAVLARHFNQPSTLKVIEFPKEKSIVRYLELAKERLHDFRSARPNITTFNGAYIIRASKDYPNKVDMVFDETVQQFVDDPPDLNTDSMEMCVEELMHYRNIGSFMAGQIAADLRWALKGKWADKDKWAAMGPGSKRGMNRLHERDVKFSLNQEQFLEELREFVAFAKKALPTSITSSLEMIDWQNCFCEFDKYSRVLLGEGRPKQKYSGGLQ